MCKVFCEIFLNMFVIFVKYFHNFPRASFVRFLIFFFVHLSCILFVFGSAEIAALDYNVLYTKYSHNLKGSISTRIA